jgi:hypothetical protein
VPVSLDRVHRRYQHVGYRLVAFAANDKVKDLPLPRRQCRDTRENCVSRLLLLKHRIVMRNGPFDSFQKLLGCYRLDEEVFSTGLDGPHSGRNVSRITGNEYDR